VTKKGRANVCLIGLSACAPLHPEKLVGILLAFMVVAA
jgi:hypothetical protein